MCDDRQRASKPHCRSSLSDHMQFNNQTIPTQKTADSAAAFSYPASNTLLANHPIPIAISHIRIGRMRRRNRSYPGHLRLRARNTPIAIEII